jgi:hypothetical protein
MIIANILFGETVSSSTSTAIGGLAQLVWEGIALGLAYGLLSMAIIQIIKDMYLRRTFNRKEFNRWLPSGTDFEIARRDLLNLAAAGDEDALFGLSIDKMAGQINVAINGVIENPRSHDQLLRVLGRAASQSDLDLLISTDPAAVQYRGADEPEKIANDRIAYADARTRVSHHLQRMIDVLQLSAAQRWTRLNQWLSLIISCVIGLAPVYLWHWLSVGSGTIAFSTVLPASVILSLIGGFLAPLLRDITARSSRSE